jgi:hypothetical protein
MTLSALQTTTRFERMLGQIDDGVPGPTVVLIGGLHGNEIAGVHAIGRVLEAIRARNIVVCGRILGVAGNLGALRARQRFIDNDLNRGWTPPFRQSTAEDRERAELLELFEPLLDAASEPVVFVDLHTSSGNGSPFACMADVLRNRPIAFACPVPVVLGLEEVIDGTMLGYLCDRGHVGVAFEGGQHDDPITASRLEAIIWVTLTTVGALERAQVHDLFDHVQRLSQATRGLPRVLEIRHRHRVALADDFRMLPGFANFVPVRRGMKLAEDKNGEITAHEDALLMLPLYQGQGDDGFFLARPVSPIWLGISAVVRQARLDRLLRILPGVSPHPTCDDEWVVSAAAPARLLTDIFHLFGYRRVQGVAGQELVFSRRSPSVARPVP